MRWPASCERRKDPLPQRPKWTVLARLTSTKLLAYTTRVLERAPSIGGNPRKQVFDSVPPVRLPPRRCIGDNEDRDRNALPLDKPRELPLQGRIRVVKR